MTNDNWQYYIKFQSKYRQIGNQKVILLGIVNNLVNRNMKYYVQYITCILEVNITIEYVIEV